MRPLGLKKKKAWAGQKRPQPKSNTERKVGGWGWKTNCLKFFQKKERRPQQKIKKGLYFCFFMRKHWGRKWELQKIKSGANGRDGSLALRQEVTECLGGKGENPL